MSDRRVEEQKANLVKHPMVPTPLITYNMVHKLECVQERNVAVPMPIEEGSSSVHDNFTSNTLAAGEPKATPNLKYAWNSPCLMILFDNGDLNSALHHLVSSLHNPFAPNAVATLLIQESLREAFIGRLLELLEPLDPQVSMHPSYVRTLAKLQQLKAETIVGNPKTVPAHATPMLVCDMTHNFFGDGPTGIVTMHTFRTTKDATVVNAKETLNYSSVCIWNEKMANAFELCALLKNSTFMINCFNVDLSPIQAAFDSNRNDVMIVKGYHYETITVNQRRKIIVYAIGTIFAN